MSEGIVLFGGTFDPVHNGHLIVARSLAEKLGFGRVTLVPTASPPHKGPARAAAEDRLEMLRLAVEGEEIFDICELELHRTGPSYTFETLMELRRRWGRDVPLHWVIGADMLDDLASWHRAGEVLEIAKIVVAVRPPWHERIDSLLAKLAEGFGCERIKHLSDSIVHTPLIEISSTQIRKRIEAGRSIKFLVPEAVRTYIEERGLYRRDRRI